MNIITSFGEIYPQTNQNNILGFLMKSRFFICTLFFLLLGSGTGFCQGESSNQKSITVHFLYGSKPAKGNEATEKKLFGQLHGGHVSIQIDTEIFSFGFNTEWHVFAHHRNIVGVYHLERVDEWMKDTADKKYTSIQIPLSDSQFTILKNIEAKYLAKSPYDYAFFGMRCAAAAGDLLSELGILKKRSNLGDIIKYFYPKRLRKKLLSYAKKNNLKVTRKQGKKSRRWEKD